MSKISIRITILITSFVMALAGLVASPIASASENGNGGISATFPFGSSVLTKAQKAAIKKAFASSGSDATFIVTGTAGKLPGVSNSRVKALAKARAKAIKAYLVSLGVSKTSITIKVKMTEIGVRPKSTGSYPTPAATPTVTAVATNNAPAAPAAPAAAACASGATYTVGSTGPCGGIVYYVDSAGFSCGPTLALVCNYLEVARSGWSTGGSDPTKLWAVSGYQSADVDGSTGGGGGVPITNDNPSYNNALGIGLGYKNSVAIVTQGNDTSTAAGAARAYAGGGTTDWYLPTSAELNLLCQWNHGYTQSVTTDCQTSGAASGTLNTGTGATTSGFMLSSYWSSSEFGASYAWRQNFLDGYQNFTNKSYTSYVRPVRAF